MSTINDLYERLDNQTKKERKMLPYSYDVMKDVVNKARTTYSEIYDNPFVKYRNIAPYESQLLSSRLPDFKERTARSGFQHDIYTFDRLFAEVKAQQPVNTDSGFGNRFRDFKEASDLMENMYRIRTHEAALYERYRDVLMDAIQARTTETKKDLKKLNKVLLAEKAVEEYGMKPSDVP